ncbi:MAG: DUF779 domain-containing protein [Rhodocyclaceae bacterium]|nr:MAG: DUF779 domain-containing protein [Rhodocyclaceae bacterium]
MEKRVMAAPEALDLLKVLKERYGPDLLFIQICGYCDHSSVYCYKVGEFMVSPQDVLIGRIDGVPYYVDASQHELFKRRQIIISVVKGDRSGDLSLEGTEGVIFRVSSHELSEEEFSKLDALDLQAA